MKNKNKFKKYFVGTMFVLPAFIGFCVFMIYPLMYSLFLSFMDWNMYQKMAGSTFIGLENYKEALTNSYFKIGILNNLKLVVIGIPLLIGSSIVLAALLNMKIMGRGLIRTMFFMPYVTMVTASAIVFSALFHPELGPINQFLMSIGVENPPGWLLSTDWALTTVALFWVWKNLGYCVVIFLAGLQGVSPSYYEAASLDGATKFQQFLHITVPMVSPTTFFLSVTCIIQSFQIFPEINVMTGGGPGRSTVTTVFHIYDSAFIEFDMGYASAVSWLFFGLILLITAVQWAGQKKWVKYV